MNATINLENKHFPVLLNELVSIISPLYGGTFLDCTFGQGGYTEKILENTQNKVITLDRNINAIKLSENDKPFREFLIWLSEYPKSKIIPFIL